LLRARKLEFKSAQAEVYSIVIARSINGSQACFDAARAPRGRSIVSCVARSGFEVRRADRQSPFATDTPSIDAR